MNVTQAQAFVDDLALKWSVPTIKVIREDMMPKAIQPCYFHPEYYIGMTDGVTEEDLKHEFIHYIVALIKIAPAIEEKIANLKY